MRVLLIEDNADLGRLLSQALSRRSIVSDWASSLGDAAAFMDGEQYDTLVLDLGLPDGDGLDWLARLPAVRPPVLVLTARGALEERVKGLDTGADDYLVKPAQVDEIAARLRALARRPGARESETLETGRLSLNLSTKDIIYDGTPILCGKREIVFLERLMRRPGRVIARDAMASAIYGMDEPVTPNALEAVASRVRKRLSDVGAGPMIHTVRGVGYFIEERDE